ncbi:MAG TPA: hypothetical protein VF121_10555 [Thermoanaerobaculia bacterium]|nr:hypothetical protein [Thermoanaerobaculia bacterium]
MKWKTLWSLTLVALLPLAFACKGQDEADLDEPEDVAAAATTDEIEGIGEPGDLNPMEAQMAVDDVTLGSKAGPDGTIAEADQEDDFTPGEPIVVAMEVGDVQPGSAIKVLWFGPNETSVGEESKTVESGQSYLNFTAGDTGSWAKGDYRVEVWIGDEKVNQQQFQIVDEDDAAT